MQQAAHDLGSFLTVSNGHRQQAEEHLAKARQADERAMQLVRQMLAGNVAPAPVLFDLNVVVRELANLSAVRVKTDGEPLHIAANEFAIFRALMNLCTNGQNAGATQIRIATRRTFDKQAMIMITVTDNGRGMSAEQVNKLWEPHLSADGMHGHGLAIVKETIEQHAGYITVVSRVGETIFSIYLPLCEVGTVPSGTGSLAA